MSIGCLPDKGKSNNGKIYLPKECRMYIIKNYLMFYEIFESHILILTIWDSRQNPVKLKL
ncbi:type II toxin-antitoxin system RelE/ParE family toxin [Salinimicrobium sp. TIG7-5_MAKvit]|uniref:type II toxin-antitoxin system RelE/ParE family toxin n=1 Tax=Salinimicrobium sp. TIG7-5_MAKvit TaxID=3121289 RepID=UPI003C6DD953